jgi:N-carbamoyl-L-amino-acid hydrolase
MIFVPCNDGISHNEAEYSSKEQCAAGAQVLFRPCSTMTGGSRNV